MATAHPWFLPKGFMGTAEVVGPAPTWSTPTGDTLVIDIVPFSYSRADYTRMPQETVIPFTHRGYTDNLGPIGLRAPDRYRLAQGGKQFKIVRIRNWDGFYELDLDEISGG
jgi:hypothetical protein